MFTIEENALKCAICGLGVLEGGPMVGGSINNSVHPNCLLIDPFEEVSGTVCPVCDSNSDRCSCATPPSIDFCSPFEDEEESFAEWDYICPCGAPDGCCDC